LVALVCWQTAYALTPDDEAKLALARFVARSAAGVPQARNSTDVSVDIEASLPQLGKRGRVEAIRHSDTGGRPDYEVLGADGDATVKQQVIARYLTVEREAYGKPASLFAISPQNYKFRHIASIEVNGSRFYVFTLKPRRRSEGLMEGQIWIDGATGAVVHERGRLTKSGSVFIRRIELVRDCGARVDTRYQRITQIEIDTRLFGRAELIIRERPAHQTASLEVLQ
jgi:hypothetical protein